MTADAAGTPPSGPVMRRRKLRTELRQERERVELTQEQVADEMDWSLSKLIRIENGAVGISTNDLKALLQLYGVTEREREERHMPSRTVVWVLAILAIVLVVIPLLSMLGMMICCGGGMMGSSGNMRGMTTVGMIWMLLAAAVIVALIVVLVRADRT